MRTTVIPSDDSGCGRYRLSWPAQALKAKGHDVRIERKPKILVNSAERPARVIDALFEDTDTVVVQRPGSYQVSQLIPILQSKGIKVVIDMDDNLSIIHPKNPAFLAYDTSASPWRNWRWAEKACEMADLVTVTTPALAEHYGKHGRVQVIPNCVPERYLNIEKKNVDGGLVTVGWAGWTPTHPEDLQITYGGVNEALAKTKHKSKFMALGDKRTFDNLGVRNRHPHVFAPPVSIDEYPEAVTQFDIGIVPLKHTEFNRCKSWLKALEYAILGVVPVVSPTEDNLRMVVAGAAVVASSPREWTTEVQRLIEDDDARSVLQKRAREFASEWTIEGNIEKWARAWGA